MEQYARVDKYEFSDIVRGSRLLTNANIVIDLLDTLKPNIEMRIATR